MVKYPNSICEAHFDVKTSEPVCIICMENEITRLRAELEAAKGGAGALRVDAERYREARSAVSRGRFDVAVCRIDWGAENPDSRGPQTRPIYKVLADDNADAAIDAARGGK